MCMYIFIPAHEYAHVRVYVYFHVYVQSSTFTINIDTHHCKQSTVVFS
jgi:hypothetical protein